MKTNSAMRALMRDLGQEVEAPFPEELDHILRAGWYTADCGALLLRATGLHARSWPCDEREVANREYEVNDIRVPEHGSEQERDRFLLTMVSRALWFTKAAMRGARGVPESDKLTALVSTGIDDDYLSHGTTVRFFTTRGGHPDWLDDLENFRIEAMMVLDMSDVDPGNG
ncbi:hypothetical protein FHX81_3623 [Saccharothrix saharensis]|uniref:Uncharacterized protein n=1 Tax=Saccharothrix saharensis TaxID=571190 RepID=A0A543JEM0_9PSEU|nr:hypothetical protein [Saccharothrix saharensis]TQM81260.1 hypothetical protein FHX81_3623 [Saccharothrix saharensis]